MDPWVRCSPMSANRGIYSYLLLCLLLTQLLMPELSGSDNSAPDHLRGYNRGPAFPIWLLQGQLNISPTHLLWNLVTGAHPTPVPRLND